VAEPVESPTGETMNQSHRDKCLACERGSDETPLIALEYRGSSLRICPQHLPLLIHDPAQLIGKLEGAEDLRPSDFHD
jgi:hypothetical protein